MKRIDEIFNVQYGVNLELNTLTQCEVGSRNAINFVSRATGNNGVTAIVERLADIEPISAGTLSVAAGGSVLETYLQPEPYYSGRDLYFLTERIKLTDTQKLFYCTCIRANKYRYNYGRQANKTLRNILVPDVNEIPKWVTDSSLPNYEQISDKLIDNSFPLYTKNWKPFRYDALFKIDRGTGPRKQDLELGAMPFVTSIDANNGITAYADHVSTHKGNTITVNRNGSVGEAYYQENPFCSTEDVHVFNPLFPMNKYIAMFLITLIKKEKYRFSYGRKWGIGRMEKSILFLPVNADGNPDWDYMERYIKSLPYSASL